jgi:phytoene dehydrogenase-like protein
MRNSFRASLTEVECEAGMAQYDAVVIGAGHNGLACAAYLGMAGLKVKVVERRPVVGGTAVTEEFHPGFRNSVAAYTVSLLQPKVIRDLELHRHGLRIVERRAQNFLPLPEGRYLLTGEGRNAQEIAKFSAKDAERYGAYEAEIERIADVLRGLALHAPPNLVFESPRQLLSEIAKLGGLGKRWWRLDRASRRALHQLFTKSAGDYLDGWFESDPLKALLGFDAIVGTLASPYTPGTAYVLLHHAFGEVNGKKSVWGHAVGGMGAVAQALAAAAAEQDVEIATDAPVKEIMIEGDRAAGVVLGNGTAIGARTVIANVNPKFLFEELLPAQVVPPRVARHMHAWKCGSGTFRINVALSKLPSFTALPGETIADHHTAGIYVAPSLAYMDRAYRDCGASGWSQQPIIEMVIPSTLDESLAPPGAHVASLFCQHTAPQLPNGASWDAHRDQVADLMIDTVESYAPSFRASVIARQVFSPLDMERTFGLPNGDIFHGALTLDQLFSKRPMLGYAGYRMPVAGLYLCGSGAHPGGGVTAAPGHNAAVTVIADFRRRSR